MKRRMIFAHALVSALACLCVSTSARADLNSELEAWDTWVNTENTLSELRMLRRELEFQERMRNRPLPPPITYYQPQPPPPGTPAPFTRENFVPTGPAQGIPPR